jgi:hypothetical protein
MCCYNDDDDDDDDNVFTVVWIVPQEALNVGISMLHT